MSPAIDLSDCSDYLDALKAAQEFPTIFEMASFLEERGLPDYGEMEEAMEKINEWCPWLWPQIDRYVLERIS